MFIYLLVYYAVVTYVSGTLISIFAFALRAAKERGKMYYTMNSNESPYHNLGAKLRMLREAQHESLREVSDAVEIDSSTLKRYEAGHDRPSEDVLLLLFSHFAVEEPSALELWHLAGYEGRPDEEDADDDHVHDGPPAMHQHMMMVMVDPRIMYSDGVEAVAGDRGVVLNFSQVNGPNGQPLTVSRIGMSREQAQMLMGVIHQVLYDMDNPAKRRLADGQGPDAPEQKTT